jgi:hypothetical protein
MAWEMVVEDNELPKHVSAGSCRLQATPYQGTSIGALARSFDAESHMGLLSPWDLCGALRLKNLTPPFQAQPTALPAKALIGWLVR